MNNPVGFDSKICSYYLWVSWLGVKYMKHFPTMEEAINYAADNPRRCLEVNEAVSDETKRAWLGELKGANNPSKCDYQFVRPVLTWFLVCVVLRVTGFLFGKLYLLLADYGLHESWVGGLVYSFLGFLVVALTYLSLFAAVVFVPYLLLKTIEFLMYRKIIVKNCS
ncbi:MAG: hypothetical protein ACRBB4_11085 [Neptuniibacter sp.]